MSEKRPSYDELNDEFDKFQEELNALVAKYDAVYYQDHDGAVLKFNINPEHEFYLWAEKLT